MKTPKQKRLRPGKAAKPAKKSGVKTQAGQKQGIASKPLKARPGTVRPTKLRPEKLKPTKKLGSKKPGLKKPGKPTVIKADLEKRDLERITPDTLRELLNGGGGTTRDIKTRDIKSREILPKIELDRLRPGIGLPLPKPKGKASLFETLNAEVPLTLFPVRLETVFDREGKRRTLKIRVYPDDIHIDDHDPRLSPEERDLGQTFWSRMTKAKGDEALQTQICTWLIDSLSEKRAAFVAEATRKGAEPPKINKASGRQPARARCLPKFWKAVGYRRKGDGTLEEVFSVKGQAIPKTLCVDPLLGEMEHATTPAGRTALWMSDFQAAVTVGMGIEVDVTDLSWLDREGLAMLMVYGVRGAASKPQSSEMQHLMQAHRFSSGLAFQAQGVPTNSVEDTRSPVASHFAAPDGTLATVLSDPVHAPDTNAGRMARALGLDAAPVLSWIEGAERDEDAGQAAMNEALWPVTWGQYFNSLMRSGTGKGKLTVPQAAIDVARARFLDDVRGAGPLPAIRVGSQPYGVLPVRAHHMPKAWANTDPWYEFLMLSLRNIWLEATPAVAKLSPGGETQADPHQGESETLSQVVRVLGGVPHPARFLVRGLQDWRRTADTNPLADLGLTLLGLVWLAVDDPTFGAEAQSILGQWGWGKAMLGPGWAHETGEMSATGANLPNTILTSLDTADLGSNAAQKARLTALKSYIGGLPISGTRKETAWVWLDHMLRQLDSHAARLDPYLGKLPIQGVTDVDGVLRAGSGDPKIGYHLYDKTAREFTLNLVVGPLSDEGGAGMILPERYLKQAAARVSTKGASGKARVFSPGGPRPQAIKPLSANVQSLIAARAAPAPSVAQPVLNTNATLNKDGSPAMAQQSARAAGAPLLKQLIDAAVPEVKGTERKGFKAALTHLATLPAATLEWHLRETLGLASNRLDAWLTALATERLREVAGPADSNSLAQFGGYGMVLDLKPGPARESEGFLHAPTMAQATTGAILRSAWLGHGREEEDSPLAVDLSSRRLRMATRLFEGVSQGRDVGEILGQDVERSLHDSQDDVILYDLRQAVLEAGKARAETRRDTTVRGPLDGLDLIEAYDAGALTAFLQTLRPVARRQRLIAAIETARASFDALGDAGLAEATHYLAQGNMARAGAVLNALSLGEAPPAELRHARTDISKSELEHRVLLALPELTDKVARKGAPGRLLTHPGLDAYVTPMLPDLSALGVDVISGDTVHRVPLLTMMKELEFSALDLICEAARPGALGRHAMAALIATGDVLLPETHVPTALGAESDTGPRVSADLEEFEELAHELSAHLGALRPARPSDFGLLETGEGDLVLGASLVARLKALALRFKTRAETLKTSAEDIPRLLPLLSLLSREGLPEALCGPDVIFVQDKTVLAGHLERLGAVLADRAQAAERAAASTEPETWIEALRQLGDAHLAPELPISGVKLPFGATLGFTPPSESRLLDWAGTYAHVRDNLRRWRVAMDTVALVTGRPGWPMALSQTTPEPETAWLGLELPEQGSAGGRSHLAVDAGGWRALVTGRACAAFVIDGWTERLPARRTTSGVAFHFDAPSSKPPQAVLVAVTPNEKSGWNEALLQRTLIETMENAQLRAVTGDELEDFGHHLPAIFVPGGMEAGPQPPKPSEEDNG